MYIDRIDTSLLYRPFLNKIVSLIVNCRLDGRAYVITSGFRSHMEQDKLYAQGRTLPGKIVTKAQGGQSAHNFGIAVDFTYDMDVNKGGLQPSWVESDYLTLRDRAVEIGLESGLNWKSFKDAPHVQLPLSKHGISLNTLHTEFGKSGIAGVFAYLDKYSW